MTPKQSRPLSVTTFDGKTIEFNNSNELYLWARRNRPTWVLDADKGIDYDKWEGDGSCTKEELEKCYENTGIFNKAKKKTKTETV